MALRWNSVVVDSADPRALAHWWAETLDWVVAYEEDDEVGIAPRHAQGFDAEQPADRSRRFPEWTFVPVPEPKTVKDRLHLDLAPARDDDQDAQVEALLARGATRVDVGQHDRGDATWVVLADPEGNEFCVLSPRD